MKRLFTLIIHELRMLLISSSTYWAGVLFLIAMGTIYAALLFDYMKTAQDERITSTFAQLFWIPVFIVVPLLTMKSVAEERRLGTLSALLSTGVSTWQLVLSKFTGAYVLYLLFWLMTFLYPLIAKLRYPVLENEIDLLHGYSLWGGFIFIVLTGILYVAIGIFTSCLTRSQLVAGMLSFTLLFLLIIGGQLLEGLPLESFAILNKFSDPLDYFRSFKQLEDFSLGIYDSRPFFLYISGGFLLLGLSMLVVEQKK